MGDNTTIKQLPFLNIIISIKNVAVIVFRIVGCSDHMESGWGKDAKYIENIPKSITKTLSLKFTNMCGVLYGASYMQKYGQFLAAK